VHANCGVAAGRLAGAVAAGVLVETVAAEGLADAVDVAIGVAPGVAISVAHVAGSGMRYASPARMRSSLAAVGATGECVRFAASRQALGTSKRAPIADSESPDCAV
jgi:hypothetical protein